MSTDLKLPRSLEQHPRQKAVEAALQGSRTRLWSGGTLEVLRVELSPALLKVLTTAANRRQLVRGLEQIEKELEAEKKGLDAARTKQAAPPSRRISRLLLVAEGGSERLYRHCESLLRKHGDRLFCLKVDTDAESFSDALFGRGRQAKAVAVMDKGAVAGVLLALASTDTPES